jgi:hypothetical protein
MTEEQIDKELDEEEEEVTAVTQLLDELTEEGKKCVAATKKLVEKALEVQEIARESQEVKP